MSCISHGSSGEGHSSFQCSAWEEDAEIAMETTQPPQCTAGRKRKATSTTGLGRRKQLRLKQLGDEHTQFEFPTLFVTLSTVVQFTKFSPIILAVLLLPLSVSACDLDGSSLTCKSLNMIPKNDFNSDIKKFEFSGNILNNLENNAFVDFPSVSSLYLFSNQIFDVGVDAFDGLDKLRTLDLSRNHISKLDPDTFKENTKLTALSLKENPLDLSSTPFLNSESVNFLDLSKCNLTTLHADTLSGLTKLQTVILLHNSLEHLPKDFLDNLPNLQRIYLHGNPWICDEDLKSLFLSKKNLIADFKDLDCFTSDELAPKNQVLESIMKNEDIPKALPLRQIAESKVIEDNDSSDESDREDEDYVADDPDVKAADDPEVNDVGNDAVVEDSDDVVVDLSDDIKVDLSVKNYKSEVNEGDSDAEVENSYAISDEVIVDLSDDIIVASSVKNYKSEVNDVLDTENDDVKEEIRDVRSVLVYLNLALIFVVVTLVVGVLVIFLRRRGYVGSRKSVGRTGDEEEDEYNGYMIPRVIHGSTGVVKANEEIYCNHVYERIN